MVKWYSVVGFLFSSLVAYWCFNIGSPIMIIMGFVNMSAVLLQAVVIYIQLTQKEDKCR